MADFAGVELVHLALGVEHDLEHVAGRHLVARLRSGAAILQGCRNHGHQLRSSATTIAASRAAHARIRRERRHHRPRADNDWCCPIRSASSPATTARSSIAAALTGCATRAPTACSSTRPTSRLGRGRSSSRRRPVRLGDYELIVSVDARIDFLPASRTSTRPPSTWTPTWTSRSTRTSCSRRPIDPEESGPMHVRTAFGTGTPRRPADERARSDRAPPRVAPPALEPAAAMRPSRRGGQLPGGDAHPRRHAPGTRRRDGARQPARRPTAGAAVPPAGVDLGRPAVRAAGLLPRGRIDPSTLSPEAQAMLPLVAGQLLREAV